MVVVELDDLLVEIVGLLSDEVEGAADASGQHEQEDHSETT